MKFVDPDGKLPDAIWDAFWITYDIASVVYDYSSGDNQQVALDVASLSADVGALLIPGLPALAGVGRLASRLGTHVKMLFAGKSNVLLINMAEQNHQGEHLVMLLTGYHLIIPMPRNMLMQQKLNLENYEKNK